jgi:hippurate hydrolase
VTLLQAGGGAHNVIPQTARLRGTVRTLDPGLRDLAERRMKEIAAGVAATFGAVIDVDYIRSYPVMVNSAAETEHAAHVARDIGGACADAPLVMGGEDFAYMLEARPGAYILVGNGDSAPVHHPDYDFNDDIIPTGCSWLAGMVEHRLQAG